MHISCSRDSMSGNVMLQVTVPDSGVSGVEHDCGVLYEHDGRDGVIDMNDDVRDP